MSAFVVSQKTMNHIINGIYWDRDFWKYRTWFLEKYGLHTETDFQMLGNDFFNMNIQSVNQRYNAQEKPMVFEWLSNEKPTKYQILKSMHCLRYQSCEGEVPSTRTFRLLEELIQTYTDYIVTNTKEYSDAGWDSD